ncbi:hypothetical protein AB0D04_37510 [Streptomyces sp. NPDC048483]|uniref:hypothetical protein n=1 Tax=Streptomyces sp. NPDC048483 TaxID=3154927 RepID=UPI0034447840
MRDSVGRGRSADTGGMRGLLLVALLALLHAALVVGICHLPSSETDRCLTRTPAPAVAGASMAGTSVSGMSVGHCVTEGPELTSAGGNKKHHPGSGPRRSSVASGCQLRHQAPTGTCGKAVGHASFAAAVAAAGDVSPAAVHTSAAGEPPGRTVVLRC